MKHPSKEDLTSLITCLEYGGGIKMKKIDGIDLFGIHVSTLLISAVVSLSFTLIVKRPDEPNFNDLIKTGIVSAASVFIVSCILFGYNRRFK